MARNPRPLSPPFPLAVAHQCSACEGKSQGPRPCIEPMRTRLDGRASSRCRRIAHTPAPPPPVPRVQPEWPDQSASLLSPRLRQLCHSRRCNHPCTHDSWPTLLTDGPANYVQVVTRKSLDPISSVGIHTYSIWLRPETSPERRRNSALDARLCLHPVRADARTGLEMDAHGTGDHLTARIIHARDPEVSSSAWDTCLAQFGVMAWKSVPVAVTPLLGRSIDKHGKHDDQHNTLFEPWVGS